MRRNFEVFRHPVRGQKSVKSGFCWPGFFFPWIWALVHQLWFAGLLLLTFNLALRLFVYVIFEGDWAITAALGLALSLVAGFKGNFWRSKSLEAQGFEYICTVNADSAKSALAKLAQVDGAIPAEWTTRLSATGLSFAPAKARRLFAVAWLTLKAAFRYRLGQGLAGVVLRGPIRPPLIIKHHRTAPKVSPNLLTVNPGAHPP